MRSYSLVVRGAAQGGLGIGPPVYALMAATAVGLIVSCFRWLLLDRFHQLTGIRRPAWNDKLLDAALSGFDYLVQNHFRYYEFCGNTLIAMLWAYGVNRFLGTSSFLGSGTDFGMLILLLVLFAASRVALTKYYTRTGRLLGQLAEKDVDGEAMFNGNDHELERESSAQRPRPVTKSRSKLKTTITPPKNPAKADQSQKARIENQNP